MFKRSGGPGRCGVAGCLAAIALAVAGCGGSTTAPTTVQTFHVDAIDPMGDALSDPRIAVSPDLVRVTGDVAAGNLSFVVQFAAGTLGRQTTSVTVLLDTDQDASTGIREPDGIGADYTVDLNAATGQAMITKADPAGCAARSSCFNAVGSAPISFGADSMRVTVPLALLGNDDGRMSFQANSYALVAPLTVVVFDFMPENNLPPARIQ